MICPRCNTNFKVIPYHATCLCSSIITYQVGDMLKALPVACKELTLMPAYRPVKKHRDMAAEMISFIVSEILK